MPKITFIVGLPGSGKTHLAGTLLQNNSITVLINDPETMISVELFLDKNLDIVLTDPNLCSESTRKAALSYLNSRYPHYDIKWIFFENDPLKCINNIKYRGDGDTKVVKNTILDYSKLYNPPNNAIKIWQNLKS